LKLARFYSEGELSAIRVTNVEETIFEVKNLFAGEQLEEEKISSLIRQNNFGEQSEVGRITFGLRSYLQQKRYSF